MPEKETSPSRWFCGSKLSASCAFDLAKKVIVWKAISSLAQLLMAEVQQSHHFCRLSRNTPREIMMTQVCGFDEWTKSDQLSRALEKSPNVHLIIFSLLLSGLMQACKHKNPKRVWNVLGSYPGFSLSEIKASDDNSDTNNKNNSHSSNFHLFGPYSMAGNGLGTSQNYYTHLQMREKISCNLPKNLIAEK